MFTCHLPSTDTKSTVKVQGPVTSYAATRTDGIGPRVEANAGISIGASELSITEKFIFVCFDTASRAAVSTRENFAKLSKSEENL